MFTGYKLCKVASRLRGKGFNIICPNHYGLCTANIAEDAVIGNETVYSKKCAEEVSDYLKISHITTDGDSKAFRGIKEINGLGRKLEKSDSEMHIQYVSIFWHQ